MLQICPAAGRALTIGIAVEDECSDEELSAVSVFAAVSLVHADS